MTPPDALPHDEAPLQDVESGAAPDGPRDTRGLFFRVFPSIILPMFLAAVDQTIVATALPQIAGSLGDVERVGWVVIAYLMATTIAAPVYGRLGDALGRKRLMFVALGLFVAASVACALAPTLLLLIAARVAQGAGGGGLMTMSQALIGESVPPRERARYQGYLASIFMVSSTFGPVAGGWLTQQFGWRSVFLVNVPLGALAAVMALRLPDRVGAVSRVRFDWIGLLFFVGFVVPLLLSLERAQRVSLAVLPGIAGLVAVALVSLVLLLRQERRTGTPLIPVGLLRQAAIWRADAMAACVGASIVGAVTFMPIYLQAVRGAGPGQVGLLLLPLTVGVAGGSLLTGRMVARSGRTAVYPSYGLAVVTVCWVFLALAAGRVPLGWLPAVFLLLSLSLGTAMPVVQVTVQMVAGAKNLGAASASVQFSRSIGAALGTATVGAVLFAWLASRDAAVASLFAEVVERGPAVLGSLAEDRRVVVAGEIAGAFRAAFLAIACFSFTGLLLAWSLPVRRI
jgi:EmrB/QacA subfamily drug resistance transporter